MKKRLISLVLALTLVAAMALPASAACVAMARSWNGFYYATNDACYARRFSCTIESDSAEQTLATDVHVYVYAGVDENGKILYTCEETFWCSPSVMVRVNSATVDYVISYIYCSHRVGTAHASYQEVWAT